MILIVSNNDDQSTNEVIDWLHHYKAPFVRMNENDVVSTFRIDLDNDAGCYTFRTRNGDRELAGPLSVWYRRGGFWLGSIAPPQLKVMKVDERDSLVAQIEMERICAATALAKMVFLDAINQPSNNSLNKVNILDQARSVGLSIPETLITNRKSDVLGFKRRHGRIITKNLAQGVHINMDDAIYTGLTTLCSERFLRSLPKTFPPALFQRAVEKWIELRSFYLDGRTYTSAIFSQADPTTSIDFRNYNMERPNRTPPFRLNEEVERKLQQLMTKIGLRSGSIDMILTPTGEYVFLEVNPIGQFKQVSHPCNYYLEKIIAQTLITDDERRRTGATNK